MKLLRRVRFFLNNEDGATAMEYGLFSAGISVAASTTLVAIGNVLNANFGAN